MLEDIGIPLLHWIRGKTADFVVWLDQWIALWEEWEDGEADR